MTWNIAIKWIMLASGLLTTTMIYAAVAPDAAMRTTFGEALEGPLARIIVRNWGVLVTLMGLLLIYGAFRPAVRSLALVIAGASKVAFIVLVVAAGQPYLARAAVAIGIDTIMVAVFAAYLLTGNKRVEHAAPAAV